MNTKPPTILIVDDDEILRAYLHVIVSNAGYHVIEAANGQEAINSVTLRYSDIVLMDINMPGIDGISALRKIRKISPTSKIIMISAEATLPRVKEAIKQGAIGFIVKPLVPSKIMSNIEACLKNSMTHNLEKS